MAWQAQDLLQAHAAASALLAYAEHTQGRSLSHVQKVRVERNEERIDLPATTRRNLELTQTLRGEDSPTLFSLLDTCMTGMGSRMLKSWLLGQLRERSQARARLAEQTKPLRREIAAIDKRLVALGQERVAQRDRQADPAALARTLIRQGGR